MPADALLSPLEEELQRARELESAGKDRVDAQEKRIAHLKDAEATAPQSVRLLDIMRETQKLQGGHVLLLEREVREWFAQKNQVKSAHRPRPMTRINTDRGPMSAKTPLCSFATPN